MRSRLRLNRIYLPVNRVFRQVYDAPVMRQVERFPVIVVKLGKVSRLDIAAMEFPVIVKQLPAQRSWYMPITVVKGKSRQKKQNKCCGLYGMLLNKVR